MLKLVAEGKKNREIAALLSLSPKTVEKHRANLMRKMGFANVSELVTYALDNGLI
jgi:DNA-binding NarL/FixJ family response regulator